MLLAVIVIRSGIMSADPVKSFVLKLVETKMNLPGRAAVLAGGAGQLARLPGRVDGRARRRRTSRKILLIWWCMFTFITSGYEHSIANMCGLLLGLLLPHGDTITWGGYWYNLGLATLGNIIGGAVFVARMYWLGSPKSHYTAAPAPEVKPAPEFQSTNGIAHSPLPNRCSSEENDGDGSPTRQRGIAACDRAHFPSLTRRATFATHGEGAEPRKAARPGWRRPFRLVECLGAPVCGGQPFGVGRGFHAAAVLFGINSGELGAVTNRICDEQ